MSSFRLVALVAAAIAMTGCSGDDDDDDGGSNSVTVDAFGGAVTIRTGAGGLNIASASFVKTAAPEPTPYTLRFNDDACVFVPLGGGTAPTVTNADAGDSVTFSTSTVDIVAAVDTNAGINYFFTGGAPFPTNVDYAINVAGGVDIPASTIGSIHMPAPLALTSVPAVITGQDLTLNWTPNVFADTLFLDVYGDDGDVICYPIDDGTFTVTAAGLAGIGSNGGFFLHARSLDVIEIDARDVLVTAIYSAQ